MNLSRSNHGAPILNGSTNAHFNDGMSYAHTEDFRSCASGKSEDFQLTNIRRRGTFLKEFSLGITNPISGEDGFIGGLNEFSESAGFIAISVLAFLLYLTVGAFAFSVYYEHWTLIDAMYFTVVTFTTCGYGDLVPQGDEERLFTIFFIIFGILLIGGIFLTVLFDNVFGAYEDMIEKAKDDSTKKFVKKSIDQVEKKDRGLFINEAKSAVTNATSRSAAVESGTYWGAVVSMLPFIVLMSAGVAYIGYKEDWDPITSAYFFVVTATSVGYGDVTPESQEARLFAVLFIPSSVMIVAELFNRFIAVYLQRKTQECEEEFLNRRMTLADFHRMDVDGNGLVTYDEFIRFFLVAMGKVKEEDMDRLKTLYDKFDANGDGDIQIADLIMIAKGQNETIGTTIDVP